MGRTRQHWSVELIDEAIGAVSDKIATLSNTPGVNRDDRLMQRIALLRQAANALRDDRAKYARRDDREAAS